MRFRVECCHRAKNTNLIYFFICSASSANKTRTRDTWTKWASFRTTLWWTRLDRSTLTVPNLSLGISKTIFSLSKISILKCQNRTKTGQKRPLSLECSIQVVLNGIESTGINRNNRLGNLEYRNWFFISTDFGSIDHFSTHFWKKFWKFLKKSEVKTRNHNCEILSLVCGYP